MNVGHRWFLLNLDQYVPEVVLLTFEIRKTGCLKAVSLNWRKNIFCSWAPFLFNSGELQGWSTLPTSGLDPGSGPTKLEGGMSESARQGKEGSSLRASLSSF